MLPWVSITPFGRPVVPEVCGSRHKSSSPTVQRTSDRDVAGARAGHGRAARRTVLDDDPWLDVLEDPANLSLVQPVIDRSHDRTEQARGEQ
jgi:hypothetical protein